MYFHELPEDPTHMFTQIHTEVLIALFKETSKCKLAKCPPTPRYRDKMCYSHIMDVLFNKSEGMNCNTCYNMHEPHKHANIHIV